MSEQIQKAITIEELRTADAGTLAGIIGALKANVMVSATILAAEFHFAINAFADFQGRTVASPEEILDRAQTVFWEGIEPLGYNLLISEGKVKAEEINGLFESFLFNALNCISVFYGVVTPGVYPMPQVVSGSDDSLSVTGDGATTEQMH
jgi:hypothetical protein